MNFNLTIWWIKHCLVVFTHNGVLSLVIKTIYSTFVANRELEHATAASCNENVTLKQNFALEVKCFAIIPCWSRCKKWQNALSLAWHESFSHKLKAKNERLLLLRARVLVAEPQIREFFVVGWQTRSKIGSSSV